MTRKIGLVLGITVLLVFVSSGLIFSQEEAAPEAQVEAQVPAEPAPTEPAPTEAATPLEPEMQWVWGEVVSIDTLKNELLVKYLDYETDEEKQMSISIDDKTIYTNIKSLDEIKAKDTISIDYIIGPDGKNIAKNISIEKAEGQEALPEETTEEEPKAEP